MNDIKFIGIIPARYASTRFPGKPLAKIAGKMMIERVWERVSSVLDEVYVATDDKRIYDAVLGFGGNAIMTSSEHRSGTDRCNEAYINSKSNAEVIINIQGDEPFISPDQIKAIMNCFDNKNIEIATLVKEFEAKNDFEDLFDKNTPKVILNRNMFAIYFSRSIIPYVRDANYKEWASKHTYYTHVGMYAYRNTILQEITQLKQSPLEIAESLEQLRWIENGYKIKVAITDFQSIGIDTINDMKAAENYIIKNNI